MFKRLVLMLMFYSMGVWMSPIAYADATDLFATGQDSSGNYLFRVTSDGGIYTAADVDVSDDLTVDDNINVGSTSAVIDAGTGNIRISTHTAVTGSITATNSTYGLKISSSSSSGDSAYFGGVFATLPTTGFSAGSIIICSSDTYTMCIATIAVTNAGCWEIVGRPQ
jgi:hypothetical protein